MKRLMSILLAAVLLCAMLPSVSATEHSGTCGSSIKWKLDTETGLLTLTGSGAMKDYSKGGAPWYAYRDDILTLDVGSNITSVGDYAFFGCKNMTSADLPGALTRISYAAFRDCFALETIEIGAKVSEIKEFAFDCCHSLDGIWIDNANKNYSSDADGVLFTKNKGTLICAPGGLAGEYEIPSGVANIGDYAFDGCWNLTSVRFPKSLTSIGTRVFLDCTSLEAIRVESGNSKFSCDESGVLFNASKTALKRAPVKFTDGEYTVPDTVTEIEEWAFHECADMTAVTIPDSVKKIGNEAFYNCRALNEIEIPDSVTSIGERVFSMCSGLTFARIGSGAESIGKDAFDGCTALIIVSVLGDCSVGDSAATLGDADRTVLYGLPGSGTESYAKKYGYKFFESDGTGSFLSGACGIGTTWILDVSAGLLTVGGSGSMTDFESESEVPWCENRSEIRKISIESGVAHLGSYAFCGCTVLTEVSFEGSPKTAGACVFKNCTALKEITLPDGLTEAGKSCFEGCTGLTQAELPASLKTAGAYLFAGCAALKTAALPAKLAELPEFAFSGCAALSSVTLNEGLHTLCDSCFSGCAALTGVTLPESLRTVGKNAFNGCAALTELVFPYSVMLIKENALSGCESLTAVTVYNPDCTFAEGDATLGAPGRVTVAGETDSATQKFAEKHGYAFAPLYGPAVPSETETEPQTEPETALPETTAAPEPTAAPETAPAETKAAPVIPEEKTDYLPIFLMAGGGILLLAAILVLVLMLGGGSGRHRRRRR